MADPNVASEMKVCTPKSLHPTFTVKAAAQSIAINPLNAPAQGLALAPEHMAVLTSAYWGTGGVHLTVEAIEDCPSALWAKILDHMNAWSAYGNVSFDTVASGGQVRVAFQQDGYWSYLGNGILHVPANEQTMNLEGFNIASNPPPASEYNRVVRHETGHTLGAPHEHARRAIVDLLDPAKVLAYFERTQGWSADMVKQQILTPLEESSILGTTADVLSIMTYQFPGQVTKSGKPIPGGSDIDPSDGAFIGRIYPKPVVVKPPVPPPIVPPTPPVTPPVAGAWDGSGLLTITAPDGSQADFTIVQRPRA